MTISTFQKVDRRRKGDGMEGLRFSIDLKLCKNTRAPVTFISAKFRHNREPLSGRLKKSYPTDEEDP